MNYYDDPTYTSTGVTINQQTPSVFSSRTRHAIRNSVEHENAKAILAGTVMQNTATLCAMGEQFSNAVPSSREDLGSIIRSYARSGCEHISKW